MGCSQAGVRKFAVEKIFRFFNGSGDSAKQTSHNLLFLVALFRIKNGFGIAPMADVQEGGS
jgi:hypothetical protein